jgi:hypothetical protein
MDHRVFGTEPYSRRAAWCWLIEHAVFRPTKIFIAHAPVTLERGQLSFSLRYLAEAWRWSKSSVSRFIIELNNETMIGTMNFRKQLIITICNYDKFQSALDDNQNAVGQSLQRSWDNVGTNNKKDKEIEEAKASVAKEIAVLMKAARFVVPPDDHRYVQEWLGLGLRLDQIETVITEISTRQIAAGKPPRMFKYFDQAVRQAAMNPQTIPDNREWWEKPENVTQLTEEEWAQQQEMLAWQAEMDRQHEERQKSRNLN